MGTVNNTPGCELKQITGGQSGIYLGGPQVWAGYDNDLDTLMCAIH